MAPLVTHRQLELLAMYASGYSIDEIATAKFLSSSTVKQTMATARKKASARSLTHLCVMLKEHDLIQRSISGDYVPCQKS
jgi:DNA-binding NarL/FixJ family response regulator